MTDRIEKNNWSMLFNEGWKRQERKYKYHRDLHNDDNCDRLSDCLECHKQKRIKETEKLLEVKE